MLIDLESRWLNPNRLVLPPWPKNSGGHCVLWDRGVDVESINMFRRIWRPTDFTGWLHWLEASRTNQCDHNVFLLMSHYRCKQILYAQSVVEIHGHITQLSRWWGNFRWLPSITGTADCLRLQRSIRHPCWLDYFGRKCSSSGGGSISALMFSKGTMLEPLTIWLSLLVPDVSLLPIVDFVIV